MCQKCVESKYGNIIFAKFQIQILLPVPYFCTQFGHQIVELVENNFHENVLKGYFETPFVIFSYRGSK